MVGEINQWVGGWVNQSLGGCGWVGRRPYPSGSALIVAAGRGRAIFVLLFGWKNPETERMPKKACGWVSGWVGELI